MKELRLPPLPSSKKPIVLGLLGGIASGKSTVAGALQAEGFVLIDADRIAKDLLQTPEVQGALLNHFGKKIFHSNGEVDKKKLADLVFEEQSEREFLEKLLHPMIRSQILEKLKQAGQEDKPTVLDAPLLLEGGLYRLCDVCLFIHTPGELRQRRALARGMDLQDWAAREAIQAPLAKKREVSHYEIENSEGKQRTFEEVQALVNRLRGLGLIKK